MRATFLCLALLPIFLPLPLSAAHRIGAAAVDITPDYSVRLSGFGFRRAESEGVHQRIWAKALAVDDGENGPAVLVTVDNLGIPDSMVRAIAARLQKEGDLEPERLAITATHTHTAPMLTMVAPTLFGEPIPTGHQARIDRYTQELEESIARAVRAALKDLQPGHLEWAVGSVGFAVNRRSNLGPRPVDHDLPLLVARTAAGKIRALHVSYACHCVTLRNNRIGGDWAGYAQIELQKAHPGAIAMVSIGCGADQNPGEMIRERAGDLDFDIPLKQGRAIADEVNRLLGLGLNPLSAPLTTRHARLSLPFDKHPDRVEWEARATKEDATGYHARVQLARLDRGEKLQVAVDYPVQTWAFGDQLAMVFLPGEVVVDYSLRLKREFDRTRIFVHAYANGAPCYIPSERILKEGGYEGGGAMKYYDRPTRFATGIEAKIIGEVRRQVPEAFRAREGCEGTAPRSPEASRLCLALPPGLRVELAAAEPEVVDPVAIDWGPDGRLWVIEMNDYPTGLDGNWQPGGRVVQLTDRDADGRMDHRQVFLDNLPFPTGLMAWRDGVLVCAAPRLLFARDTTGDGRADEVTELYTGFEIDNYQARVNGLHWGLDNWIHAANGLLGGTIEGPGGPLDIRGHDFRFRLPGREVEQLSGLSQQGRVRDDWGNSFGCTNGQLAWHFPLPERYARRNPHVTLPGPRVAVADDSFATLSPRSRLLERFNNPASANRVTSGCGIGVYRDDLLGAEYAGDLFTCEPVHNLVVQLDLKPEGATFTAHRTKSPAEFLASTDNWFRPVQVRTGPDGALWVVDMYRFLIEHPRWVAHDRLAEIDVRAGDAHGRIYRIVPADKELRAIPSLPTMPVEKIASLLESPNGPVRDLVHRLLLQRGKEHSSGSALRHFRESPRPRTRLQSLSILDGLGAVTPGLLGEALADTHPAVRRHALRLSEPWLEKDRTLYERALRLAGDKTPGVRFQLALSLGASTGFEATSILGDIAAHEGSDRWMRAAILTSALSRAQEMWALLNDRHSPLVEPLIATAVGSSSEEAWPALISLVLPREGKDRDVENLRRLAVFDDALRRRGPSLASLIEIDDPLRQWFDGIAKRAADSETAEPERLAAIRMMGRGFLEPAADRELLMQLLDDEPAIRQAALERLLKLGTPEVAGVILEHWERHGPKMRASILNALLSRPDWTKKLLAHLEAGKVGTNELTLAQRDRLRRHAKPDLRARAAAVLEPPAGNRQAVLTEFAAVTGRTGDPVRGAVLFRQVCATCHAFRGQGHAVGPRLDSFYTKPVADYLVAILDPNAVVEPSFVQYVLHLADGRELAGIVKSESATGLTLALPAGLQQTLLKKDVARLRVASISLMPEGLEEALPPDKMADLLAYLRSPQ